MTSPSTIAFVPPRYGPEVVGGAEAVVAELARLLQQRGHPVEILTTTAVDHFTWADHYPAGVSDDAGITVRRFPTIVSDEAQRERLGTKLLSGEHLTISEQQRWVNAGLRVPGLHHHVLHNASDYRAIIFAPYLFWTTFAVAQIAPERTILMPCLHDEPPAHLEIFQPVFSDVAGCWFLSDPEQDLARQLFTLPPHAVIGSGVDTPQIGDLGSFVEQHQLDRPYVFFAGRREWGKGWNDLLDAFTIAVNESGVDLALVTCGVGAVEPAASVADRVIDLGFVDDATRDLLMAGARAYVQPSAMESFSRTVLEAMLARVPVIANGDSTVVSWHLERSGAGVTYRGVPALAFALTELDRDPESFAALGTSGPAYVESHYRWDAVVDLVEESLDRLLGEVR